jgi:predicted site-specific integrase-resolvase
LVFVDNVYRIGEFADRVGRSASTVRRWERERRITAKRTATGKRYLLLVAGKDRLARFGLEYLEHVAPRAGCEIVVANQLSLSPERELTEDLLAIVHTFCCRLYGLRKYRKTLQQALTADVTR